MFLFNSENTIYHYISDISPDEVYRHGSLPAKYLFTWVSACSGILEHRANDAKKLVVDTKNRQLDDNREQKS